MIFVVCTSIVPQHVRRGGVQHNLCLRGWRWRASTWRISTYVENVKYGVQVLSPNIDRILIALRWDQSKNSTSFTLLGELLLHLSDGTATSALFGALLTRRPSV